MDKEDAIKLKLFNTIPMNKNKKKKYFRIEKTKLCSLKGNKTKTIFKTKKENTFLNRKTVHDIENMKSKNNKFITTTIDDSTASVQSDNSFFVHNIIPKKLIVKENKKEPMNTNYFSKTNEFNLYYQKEFLFQELSDKENNENKTDNINMINYRTKLMLVYFYSIKNLCKYINNNLFNLPLKDNKIMEGLLYQVYQDLQILNRKINKFKFFESIKDNLKINKDEFKDIYFLKDNLNLMKAILTNNMSQNLINIFINIDNFCRIFSP